MRSPKIRTAIIILVLIILVVSIYAAIYTPFFLNWRVRIAKQRLAELFADKKLEMQSLATAICEESQQSGILLSYDKYQSNFPTALEQQLTEFLKSTSVNIHDVYICGNTFNEHPANACVFRCTIPFHYGVYAWVDLVYDPSPEPQNTA